jgi:hypothetical protein
MRMKPIIGNAVECADLDEEDGSRVVTATQVVRNDVVEVGLEGEPDSDASGGRRPIR